MLTSTTASEQAVHSSIWIQANCNYLAKLYTQQLPDLKVIDRISPVTICNTRDAIHRAQDVLAIAAADACEV
jgi:hypothetical protein